MYLKDRSKHVCTSLERYFSLYNNIVYVNVVAVMYAIIVAMAIRIIVKMAH